MKCWQSASDIDGQVNSAGGVNDGPRVDAIVKFEADLTASWTDGLLQSWAIAELPVWPLICHAVTTVAIERYVLCQQSTPNSLLGRLALLGYSHFGENVISGPSRKAKTKSPRWWDDGDVVSIATVSAVEPVQGFCRTTDAFRLQVSAHGIGTPLLYCDARTKDALVAANPLGNDHAIGENLRHMATTGRRRTQPSIELPGFCEWARPVGDTIGVRVNDLSRWLGRLIDHALAYRDAFTNMLRSASPRAFLLTHHGDALTTGLCAAAAATQTSVVCVQHGVLRRPDPEHPLHPSNGAGLMPTPPSHWLWRDEKVSARDRCVGPPSLSLSLDPPGIVASPPVERALQTVRKNLAAAVAKGVTHEDAKIEEQIVMLAPQTEADGQQMAEFVAKLKSPVRCRWRPHPRLATNKRVNQAAQAAIRAAGAKEVTIDREPLGPSLLTTDYLVTGYSAVALEAAALGIPVRFLSTYAKWMFEGQMPPHLAHHVDSSIATIPAPELQATSSKLDTFRHRFGPLRDTAVSQLLTPNYEPNKGTVG